MIRYSKFLKLLIICAFPTLGSAQINLVYNGSFEEIRLCPDSRAQIMYANHWHSLDTVWAYDTSSAARTPTDMPALFSTCGLYPYASIPTNLNFNYHEARTGGNAVQLITYHYINDSGGARQHAQGKLRTTLVAGRSYCVSFFISLIQASSYANNMLGAYLDNGAIDTVQFPRQMYVAFTRVTPQVYDTTLYTDTLNWHQIQGNFTATGNEKFITIANFFDNAHTRTTPISISTMLDPSGACCGDAAYFIDDVSVIALDAIADAGRDTSISKGEVHDSAWIGNHDGYVPCRWYRITASGEALIDSNKGGFLVKPDSSTRYIMELEVCGHVTRDTVTVNVSPSSISPDSYRDELGIRNVSVYPNPAMDELTIEVDPSSAKATAGEGCEVVVYDVVGRLVKRTQLRFGNKRAQLSLLGIAPGTYTLSLLDAYGRQFNLRFVKE